MAKVHVISDEKLGGVEREYVEVDRRAEVGDIAIQTSDWMDGRNTIDKVADVIGDTGITLGENVLFHDEYKTLEPTDIVVINGVRYHMVDRKAESDDLIIVSEMFEENNGHFYDVGHVGRVVKTGMDDVMVDFNGFYTPLVDSVGIRFSGYHVLEPVEDKSDDKQLDHTANLALCVVELERVVKLLSDILIKHAVDIHRLKNETEYLDETWRSTREVQLAMSYELEAIKCEK